jgi:WD40 repeat protein
MATAVASVASTAVLPETPYKGLTPYSEDDAPFFFGRDGWREIITDNLKAYRLTLLYGESGVGKSSVLRAGVAYHLHEEGRRNVADHGTPDTAVVVFSSWRDDPLAGLVDCIGRAAGEGPGADRDRADTPVGLEDALEFCARRVRGRVYVILDQFEEYFVYHPVEKVDEPFAREFPGAVGRRDLRVSFLLSIREDAVAKLDRFKGRLPNLFDNYLRIEHLDRDAAREAIELPLQLYNSLHPPDGPVQIEPELVEAVVNDVEAGRVVVGGAVGAVPSAVGAGAHVEAPYLQLVMTRLWDEEIDSGSRVLRLETLERLGGAEGIVTTHLDAAMSSLPREERDVAASAFRYLVTRSRTKIAHSTSDLADWTDIPESTLASVLEKLAGGDARILRPVGESSFEIYHDVLAEAVLAWRAGHEARRRSEQERRQAEAANRRKLLRVATIVGLIGLLVAFVFAVLFRIQKNDANHQKNEANVQRNKASLNATIARSRELAAASVAQLRTNPDLSLLLAKAAVRIHPSAEALYALRKSLVESNADVALSGHTDYVEDAELSRDSRWAVTASDDGSARLWDTTTGRQMRTVQYGAPDGIQEARISRDGRLILTTSGDFRSQVRNAATGQLMFRLPQPCFGGYEFSPDSQLILGRCEKPVFSAHPPGGTVRVFRATTGHRVAEIPVTTPSVGAEFSPDSRFIVTTERGRRVRVWNARSGQRMATFRGVGHNPYASFANDLNSTLGQDERYARFILTTGRGRTLGVWRVAGTQQLVSTLHVVARRGTATFSPNDRFVVTTGRRGSLSVWSATSGRLIRTVDIGRRSDHPELSSDGRLLLVTSMRAVRVWSTKTGHPVATLRNVGRHPTATFSPNDRLIATTASGSSARVWEALGGHLVTTLRGTGRYPTAEFSRDSRLLLIRSNDLTPRIWRVPARPDIVALRKVAISRGCRFPLEAPTPKRACLNATAAFSPNGALVLTAGGGRQAAHLWNATTGTLIHTLRGGGKPIATAAFDPSGRQVVTASRSGTTRVWNTSSGRLIHELAGRKPVVSAEFSADGRHVATASVDGMANVWDPTTGRSVVLGNRKGTGHTRAVDSAAFSRDGKLVVTAGEDDTARIWDAATGRGISVLRPRKPVKLESGSIVPYVTARFSADRDRVLVASRDGAVRVWTLAPGNHPRPTANPAVLLPTRKNLFNSADFGPDGTRVIAPSDDGTTHLWMPTKSGSNDSLGSPGSFKESVIQAQFSPDGRLVVTAGQDGTTRLWDAATESPLTLFPSSRGFVSVLNAGFSRDGTRIVAVNDNGEAQIITCDVCGSVNSLLALADERTGRKLTQAEQRRYRLRG